MNEKNNQTIKMILEKNRYETFKSWPFDSNVNCSPEKMAEAGFYSCGSVTEPDSVACFLCGKELDGWEASDDPWKEHTSHAKQCMFVQLGKPEKDMTLSEFISICYQHNLNRIKISQEDTMKKFKQEIETLRSNIVKGKLSNS